MTDHPHTRPDLEAIADVLVRNCIDITTDDARFLADAVLSLMPEAGWRDMDDPNLEGIKRDATDVLVYSIEGIELAWFSEGQDEWMTRDGTFVPAEPIAWMPLPQAPDSNIKEINNAPTPVSEPIKSAAVLGELIKAVNELGLRDLVAGWNGENREDGPLEPHPNNLGVTLKTNAGTVYAIDAALRSLQGDQAPDPVKAAADHFDRQDYYYRDYDPDDSGDNPGEALRYVPLLCVSLVHSSTSGPSKFCFRAETLDQADDEETLCFGTEEEALEAAKERDAALRDLQGET